MMGKFKRLFISFAAVFAVLSSHAGHEVNNGGGIAEKNIIHAYRQMTKYLNICIGSPSCQLAPEEKEMLKDIRDAMTREYASQDQIQFTSELNQPGFFTIEGYPKIAKTGSTVGSPIYFNLDMIYAENIHGKMQALTISDAIAHLIHELGHHHGDWDHTRLDSLGAKVALFLQQYIMTTPLLPTSQAVSATVINDVSRPKSFPTVVLSVFDEMIDISKKVEHGIGCRLINLPIPINPDIFVPGGDPDGALLHNLHWTKFPGRPDGRYQITGNVASLCDGKTIYDDGQAYTLEINFRVVQVDGEKKSSSYMIDANSISVSHEYNRAWKIIQLPGF